MEAPLFCHTLVSPTKLHDCTVQMKAPLFCPEPAYFNPEDGSTTVLSDISIPLLNYLTAQSRSPNCIFYYDYKLTFFKYDTVLASQDL
jgi:hypothetical protein